MSGEHHEVCRSHEGDSSPAAGQLINIDQAGWSELDKLVFDAAQVNRYDGFRVEHLTGAGGCKETSLLVRLGGDVKAIHRLPPELLLDPKASPMTRYVQERLLLQLLGSITDCMNNGMQIANLLDHIVTAFQTGEFPVGLQLRDAKLLDIRCDSDDDDQFQRHYLLADGRYMIWTENVYIEILTAEQYADLLLDEAARDDDESEE